MTPPEVGDRAKIWRVVRHDHHEIDPLGACLRDPPRGIKTRAIGIEQQAVIMRIEWRLTKPAFVTCDDLRQIQVLARQSDDELPDGPPAHNRRPPPARVVSDQLSKDENVGSCLKRIRFVPKMAQLLGHAPREIPALLTRNLFAENLDRPADSGENHPRRPSPRDLTGHVGRGNDDAHCISWLAGGRFSKVN